jgi:hypothetical protein
VYSIPIILFLDDVSGNRSRQWNKHFCCYMSNGALPREQIEAQFHVRFAATSPHATPLEIMRGIRDDIECVLSCNDMTIELTHSQLCVRGTG